jgi:hypothetical protein
MALLLMGATAAAQSGDLLISHQELQGIYEQKRPQLRFPLPGGLIRTFDLVENDFLPRSSFRIRSLTGRSIEDPACVANFVLTPRSVSAQIFTTGGTHYVESITRMNSVRLNFSQPGTTARVAYQCLTAIPEGEVFPGAQLAAAALPADRNVLRTFRLAPAATGEFTEFHGSKEGAILEVITAMSRANGIFTRELGISFQLVPGFEQMIFDDPETDPYSSNEPSEQLLDESQVAFDEFIGTENYDLGILLTRGLFGLAYFSSVCDPARKGMNCVGLPEPKGDAFHVNLVTHELAHQFGAKHTFNSSAGFCAPRRDGFSAFEPAAGSTLMSYASLPCGEDSFQNFHDDYFHSQSLKQILDFVNSSLASCAQVTPRNNTPPEVTTDSEIIIPTGTPFALTASGTDAENDTVFYCWEQRDLGPARTLDAPDDGEGPLFRSFPPTTNSTRIFPRLELILSGTDAPDERLPTLPRVSVFRVTVRDSHHNGAVDWADVRMQVVDTGAPFRITSHGSAQTISNTTLVQWDVAGTTNGPIFASHVGIYLSTNAGQSFDIILASSTPNDGEEEVVIPNLSAVGVRIKVQPINNIFFDINDAPLTISAGSVSSNNVVYLSAFRSAAETFTISWEAEINAEYRLEEAFTFQPDIWTEVLRTNASSTNITYERQADVNQAFYRVVRE